MFDETEVNESLDTAPVATPEALAKASEMMQAVGSALINIHPHPLIDSLRNELARQISLDESPEGILGHAQNLAATMGGLSPIRSVFEVDMVRKLYDALMMARTAIEFALRSPETIREDRTFKMLVARVDAVLEEVRRL